MTERSDVHASEPIPVFVINLDRATKRWATASEAAKQADVSLFRVAAIDGKALSDPLGKVVDERLFRARNGRRALPGEIGCFLSHRKALETFLSTKAEYGLIMEDDAVVSRQSMDRLSALLDVAGSADVVKLINHRSKGFIAKATSTCGDRLGRTLFGPQGSAACYCVSRAGARRILASFVRMTLPYDVELDRGWSHGLDVRSADQNIFAFSKHRKQSDIAKRKQYREVKLRWYQRIETALFRASDHLGRFLSAANIRN